MRGDRGGNKTGRARGRERGRLREIETVTEKESDRERERERERHTMMLTGKQDNENGSLKDSEYTLSPHEGLDPRPEFNLKLKHWAGSRV